MAKSTIGIGTWEAFAALDYWGKEIIEDLEANNRLSTHSGNEFIRITSCRRTAIINAAQGVIWINEYPNSSVIYCPILTVNLVFSEVF